MRSLRSLVAGLLVVMLATGAGAQSPASRISPEVTAELDAAGVADVFVFLREPAAQPGDLTTRRHAIHSLCARVLTPLRTAAIRVHHEFGLVSAFTASASRTAVAQLLADPTVVRVDPMRYGSGALAQSVPQIRADAVHRRSDLGQGVTVAVLDTGFDPLTPDIAGSVTAEHCFCTGGCCPNGASEQSGTGSATTLAVHGNHVTGILVSKGTIAPTGVAPGADVVAVKVLNNSNRGFLGDWIAALEWVATERPEVRAINMSLVSDSVFPSTCDDADSYNMTFAQVIGLLRSRGTLTFVAAGNGGRSTAIASPACVSGAVSVGAVLKDDEIWVASDAYPNLDLLGPGVGIVSTGLGTALATLSGTSMATPHATGTAALLMALNPTLGADAVEAILKRSGVRILDPRNGLTFPRLNALSAMNAVLDVTAPLPGGGSGQRDCLVEFDVAPTTAMVRQPIGGGTCRDNDPACDTDLTPGRCAFSLSVCLNVPDRRLPNCATSAPIVAYRRTPSRTADAVDLANAAALDGALPTLPVAETDRCSAPFSFVVPTGQARWLRLGVQAGDGRKDSDRLRFRCLP